MLAFFFSPDNTRGVVNTKREYVVSLGIKEERLLVARREKSGNNGGQEEDEDDEDEEQEAINARRRRQRRLLRKPVLIRSRRGEQEGTSLFSFLSLSKAVPLPPYVRDARTDEDGT